MSRLEQGDNGNHDSDDGKNQRSPPAPIIFPISVKRVVSFIRQFEKVVGAVDWMTVLKASVRFPANKF